MDTGGAAQPALGELCGVYPHWGRPSCFSYEVRLDPVRMRQWHTSFTPFVGIALVKIDTVEWRVRTLERRSPQSRDIPYELIAHAEESRLVGGYAIGVFGHAR